MGKVPDPIIITKEVKEKIRKSIRKKEQKKKKKNREPQTYNASNNAKNLVVPVEQSTDVEIEYVERDEYLLTGKFYEEFKNVFQFFATPKYEDPQQDKQDIADQSDDDETNELNDKKNKKKLKDDGKISRKKRKQLKMLKVAQLKALVKRPDVVEAWDVTSPDPLTLVFLKSYKNTVPVPRHWCQKRKFLQNKRGILKPPFKLPPFIEATGIARLRDPLTDADGGKMVRQKLKERMNPKLGKIDIDYEILHDAFFKHQVKPKLTMHGDIYYEGKEDEVKMKSYRPGKISDELRQALGISDFAAPPWIINMQRYGPPPSYPNLKIPGLNTPIPESGNYSFLYSKPEEGKYNFYSDNYLSKGNHRHNEEDQKMENFLWGELVEEEEEEEIDEAPIENYLDTANLQKSEVDTKSGISSIISGIETPNIDIRKQTKNPIKQSEIPKPNTFDTSGKPLFQILEPIQVQGNEGIFGSSHGYIIPGNEENPKDEKKNIGFKF